MLVETGWNCSASAWLTATSSMPEHCAYDKHAEFAQQLLTGEAGIEC